MTNKDTSPLDLITLLTSDPINYSTKITLSTTASKYSTTASITTATTKGTTTTTTEIILHSSDSSIPELGKTKTNFFFSKKEIIHLQILKKYIYYNVISATTEFTSMSSITNGMIFWYL
jgi:hypothetical protein